MELEITWARTIRVWWALLWRNLLVMLGVLPVSFVVGGIVGFVLGTVGASVETIQLIAAPLAARGKSRFPAVNRHLTV